jgi:predicted RNase H-like HicB family nuclease
MKAGTASQQKERKKGQVMRALLAALGVGIVIAVGAAPAYADPDGVTGDDAGFLSAIQKVGIHYPSPAQAITAGKSVCGCLNNGESALELVHEVKVRNAGFTMEEASNFAMIAAKYYCPQQLSKS